MFSYLIWLREVDSTQDILKKAYFPTGTVAVADRQKKGKGRKGRRWESQEGGLYFSFVLSEEDFSDLLQIPLVVGLGVSETLNREGVGTVLKWPNDVFAKGKKIAGVLAERTGGRVIVGVGLNVNQKSFGEEIAHGATSLYQLTGRERDRVDLLCRLLEVLKRNLEKFKETGFTPFRKRIEERLIFKGEEVVILSEKAEAGILKGIDEKGFLLLQTADGEKRITTGDVSLRLNR